MEENSFLHRALINLTRNRHIAVDIVAAVVFCTISGVGLGLEFKSSDCSSVLKVWLTIQIVFISLRTIFKVLKTRNANETVLVSLRLFEVLDIVWFGTGNLFVFDNISCHRHTPIVFYMSVIYLASSYVQFIFSCGRFIAKTRTERLEHIAAFNNNREQYSDRVNRHNEFLHEIMLQRIHSHNVTNQRLSQLTTTEGELTPKEVLFWKQWLETYGCCEIEYSSAKKLVINANNSIIRLAQSSEQLNQAIHNTVNSNNNKMSGSDVNLSLLECGYAKVCNNNTNHINSSTDQLKPSGESKSSVNNAAGESAYWLGNGNSTGLSDISSVYCCICLMPLDSTDDSNSNSKANSLINSIKNSVNNFLNLHNSASALPTQNSVPFFSNSIPGIHNSDNNEHNYISNNNNTNSSSEPISHSRNSSRNSSIGLDLSTLQHDGDLLVSENNNNSNNNSSGRNAVQGYELIDSSNTQFDDTTLAAADNDPTELAQPATSSQTAPFEQSNSTNTDSIVNNTHDLTISEILIRPSLLLPTTSNIAPTIPSTATSTAILNSHNKHNTSKPSLTTPATLTIVRYPCRGHHYFHTSCLHQWLQSIAMKHKAAAVSRTYTAVAPVYTCPVCRETPSSVLKGTVATGDGTGNVEV